jgi:calcineurin-like phosphoesterase
MGAFGLASVEAVWAPRHCSASLRIAYTVDAGMCGDYDSVIGMQKEAAVAKFVRKMPGERLTPAEGPATICGAFVETDD